MAPSRGVSGRGALLHRSGGRPVGSMRPVARPPPQVYEDDGYGAGYDDAAYESYDSYENNAGYGGNK